LIYKVYDKPSNMLIQNRNLRVLGREKLIKIFYLLNLNIWLILLVQSFLRNQNQII